jgi:hypothetical protein
VGRVLGSDDTLARGWTAAGDVGLPEVRPQRVARSGRLAQHPEARPAEHPVRRRVRHVRHAGQAVQAKPRVRVPDQLGERLARVAPAPCRRRERHERLDQPGEARVVVGGRTHRQEPGTAASRVVRPTRGPGSARGVGRPDEPEAEPLGLERPAVGEGRRGLLARDRTVVPQVAPDLRVRPQSPERVDVVRLGGPELKA